MVLRAHEFVAVEISFVAHSWCSDPMVLSAHEFVAVESGFVAHSWCSDPMVLRAHEFVAVESGFVVHSWRSDPMILSAHEFAAIKSGCKAELNGIELMNFTLNAISHKRDLSATQRLNQIGEAKLRNSRESKCTKYAINVQSVKFTE
jgi:hypothetical protein